MNSTERAFYGSPFWAQKGTFFKCSDKNESFYLQKVCFSDRENLSTSSPPKNRKNTTLFMNRVGKLNTTLSMNRVGKLSTTLSMNRVVRWELVLQRICRNSDRFILRSNICGVDYD
ncbi:hypothetical protein LEP1GSC158_2424 [Leptospira interrogans serovar Zanoni str. LT2156]|uniref:Uncharacterized protein n=1 Tax=Leptospira interrogans serovar Zanoni str. LT2156 TaxID=1001601 RepID=M6HLE1_LEPIR|nr:hypothetical protein LEP1GSC158_2424 [Leptospira interrogans serovar Zanoni str. LT2156]